MESVKSIAYGTSAGPMATAAPVEPRSSVALNWGAAVGVQGVVVGQDAVLGDAGPVDQQVVEPEPAAAARPGAEVETGLAVAVERHGPIVVGVDVGALVDAVLAVVVEGRVLDVVGLAVVLPDEDPIHQVVVGDVAGEAPHAVRVVPDLLGPVEAGRVGGALHPDGHRMLGPVPLALHHLEPVEAELAAAVLGFAHERGHRPAVGDVVRRWAWSHQ